MIIIGFLTLLHIVVCVLLILVVLLQSGKGMDLSSLISGSGGSLFGPTGGKNIMNKFTTVLAVMFMVTCLLLATLPSKLGTGTTKLQEDLQKESANMQLPASPAPLTTPDKNIKKTQTAAPAKQAPVTQPVPVKNTK